MSGTIRAYSAWEGKGLGGLPLLLAHCANLAPDELTARERLDVVLGPELARKLVFALCSGAPSASRVVLHAA
jgi:hypothetical protein